MRWFVGIPVPLATAREMAGRAAHAPVAMDRARLLSGEDLHVTLRFFGEIAETRLEAIAAALLPLRQPAFAVELDGVGAFRSVGAIYAAVAASEALRTLAEAVNESLAWHGFPRELRPFHPHVTLARVRRAMPHAELARWSEAWAPMRFVADRVAIFRSRDHATSSVENRNLRVTGPWMRKELAGGMRYARPFDSATSLQGRWKAFRPLNLVVTAPITRGRAAG